MNKQSHKSSPQEDWSKAQSIVIHIKSIEARNQNTNKEQAIHLHTTGIKILVNPSRVVKTILIMKKRTHCEWHHSRNHLHE